MTNDTPPANGVAQRPDIAYILDAILHAHEHTAEEFADLSAQLVTEVDKWRNVADALAELARTVLQECDHGRFGSRDYDITKDHLWEVADVALARYREALG